MELTERIIRLLAETFNIPENTLGLESSQDTVEAWDSMGHLQLILAIESDLNIRFKTTELDELKSVRLLVEKIENMTN